MPKPKKEKKVKEPKLFKSAVAPTGEFNQEYINELKKAIAFIKQRSTLNDNVREIHANIKKTFNMPAYASRNQVKLMMMDPETRTEIERNIEISRRMVGDQLSFNLVEDSRNAAPIVGGDPVEEGRKMMAH